MVYGIPEFRLPKAIVQREVGYLQRLGCEFKCDFVVGKRRTIGELMEKDGYDAISIGVGAVTVILAAGAGRSAGMAIDKYLKDGEWWDPNAPKPAEAAPAAK